MNVKLVIVCIIIIIAGCKKEHAHQQPLYSSIITTPADSITAVSVVSGGTINSNIGLPVLSKGICIDTSPNPSILSNFDPFYQQINSGNGFGTFSVRISGLQLNTTYHIRAYAELDSNNQSVTRYGNDISFTTPSSYTIGLFT